MKYVLMCGGNYNDKFKIPKQLLIVDNEVLVERTIKLLKENNINDIVITTNVDSFNYLEEMGVEIVKTGIDYKHDNPERHKNSSKSWLNAYYPFDEPCCYLHGDVFFSEKAIKTIVETPVKNTMFFCIRDVHDGRPIGVNPKGREPLAYKVENQKVFRKAIKDLFRLIDDGDFKQDPISWNLYRKINHIPLDYNGYGNGIFNTNGDYIAIDDYSTDVDSEKDIEKIEKFLNDYVKGGIKMVRAEATAQFSLGKFNELKNIVRANPQKNNKGELYKGDTFECKEDMAEYLGGKNHLNKSFIKILEIIPEKKIEEVKPVEEEKKLEVKLNDAAPKAKRTRKKKIEE